MVRPSSCTPSSQRYLLTYFYLEVVHLDIQTSQSTQEDPGMQLIVSVFEHRVRKSVFPCQKVSFSCYKEA